MGGKQKRKKKGVHTSTFAFTTYSRWRALVRPVHSLAPLTTTTSSTTSVFYYAVQARRRRVRLRATRSRCQKRRRYSTQQRAQSTPINSYAPCFQSHLRLASQEPSPPPPPLDDFEIVFDYGTRREKHGVCSSFACCCCLTCPTEYKRTSRVRVSVRVSVNTEHCRFWLCHFISVNRVSSLQCCIRSLSHSVSLQSLLLNSSYGLAQLAIRLT